MNKIIKYSGLAISFSLLAACSGGGGGNSADNPDPNYDKNQVTTTTKLPSINYVRDDLKAEVTEIKKFNLLDPYSQNVVKTLDLASYPEGTIKETFKGYNDVLTTYIRIINQAYSYTVALHTNDTATLAENSYATGYPSEYKNLPKGSAVYHGTSLGLNSSGSLTLTANFDDKNVQGKIYNRKLDNGTSLADITLEKATINSSLYNKNAYRSESVANFNGFTSSNGKTGYYSGIFAGPNAEEVVGMLTENRNENPYESFAGKR